MYSALFDKEIVDPDETAEEKRERLLEEKAAKKWAWYNYAYCLAKGDITKMESVMKLNFIFTLTHKSFELENKKIKEWYDYQRYNLGQTK